VSLQTAIPFFTLLLLTYLSVDVSVMRVVGGAVGRSSDAALWSRCSSTSQSQWHGLFLSQHRIITLLNVTSSSTAEIARVGDHYDILGHLR